MTTTNYQSDDQKGRDLFKLFCNQQPTFIFNKEARFKFAPWDVSYTHNKQNYIGEIKVRKYTSTTYDWYLQTDKLENLKTLQAKIPNSKISYINFFDDNITLIWNLDEIEFSKIETGLRLLQENDYSDKKVLKPVYLLPHSLAQKFETDETKSIFKPLMEHKAKMEEEDEDWLPF